jgi:hypothetical protein
LNSSIGSPRQITISILTMQGILGGTLHNGAVAGGDQARPPTAADAHEGGAGRR